MYLMIEYKKESTPPNYHKRFKLLLCPVVKILPVVTTVYINYYRPSDHKALAMHCNKMYNSIHCLPYGLSYYQI